MPERGPNAILRRSHAKLGREIVPSPPKKQPRPHAHGAPARISWATLLIMAFDRRQVVGLEITRMVLDACYRDFVIARYKTEKKLVRQSQCRRNDK